MARVFPITLVCHPDEPCFNLSELNRLTAPPNQVLHRYQVVIVVRDDRLAEYCRDLGTASCFTRPEFRIPGGVTVGHGRVEILHTVAELMEVADSLRGEAFSLPFAPADLTRAYYDYIEQVPKVLKRQSTFGPVAQLQR